MAEKINITVSVNPAGVIDKFPLGSLKTEKDVELAAKYLIELLCDKYIHSFYSDFFFDMYIRLSFLYSSTWYTRFIHYIKDLKLNHISYH